MIYKIDGKIFQDKSNYNFRGIAGTVDAAFIDENDQAYIVTGNFYYTMDISEISKEVQIS